MHNDRCVPLRDLIQPILPETDPKGLGVGTRPAASLFTWTSWLPDLPDFVRASAVTTAPLRVQRLRLLLFSLCRCVQRPVCAGSGVDGDTTSLRPLTQPPPTHPLLPAGQLFRQRFLDQLAQRYPFLPNARPFPSHFTTPKSPDHSFPPVALTFPFLCRCSSAVTCSQRDEEWDHSTVMFELLVSAFSS